MQQRDGKDRADRVAHPHRGISSARRCEIRNESLHLCEVGCVQRGWSGGVAAGSEESEAGKTPVVDKLGGADGQSQTPQPEGAPRQRDAERKREQCGCNNRKHRDFAARKCVRSRCGHRGGTSDRDATQGAFAAGDRGCGGLPRRLALHVCILVASRLWRCEVSGSLVKKVRGPAMDAIDLNADLGESVGGRSLGDDEAILSHVSSANIACGFHAGDPAGILRTCRLAADRAVTIGAHPGYHDLAGFGRRFIEYDPTELEAEIIYQVGALRALAARAGTEVRYIKPHGALYNALAHHEGQAGAVVGAAAATELPLMVQAGSLAASLAQEAGIVTISEAFADRGYRADGTLVPRSMPGAVLGPEAAVAQAIRIATAGTVVTESGVEIAVAADSLCLHGDSPGAVMLAGAIRVALAAAGVTVRARA